MRLLRDQLRAVAPLAGISIGNPADKSTWRVRFTEEATDEQKAAAAAVLAAFDPLSEIKADAIKKIDRAAEVARLKYITPGAGQALTYQRKSMERMAYLSAVRTGAPVTKEVFSMLWASVGIEVDSTGDESADIGAAATLIGARENTFAQIGAAIERARLTAKAAIEAADSERAVQAATEVDWP